MKRVAIISDLHCGHLCGLTPPSAQGGRYEKIQRQLWAWYEKTAQSIGHVDVLVINGDAIDGAGEKSGGTELFTTNRLEQVELAVEAARCFDFGRVYVVAGTAYHAGVAEEFEEPLADKLSGCASWRNTGSVARYGGEAFFMADEVAIHAKHHISVAALPHTKATPVLKALLMDALSSTVGAGGEKADIVVRSHAHSFMHVDCDLGKGYVTDGLQVRSRYGRRLDGWSDMGMLLLEVDGKNSGHRRYRFHPASMARVADRI